jgi:hypothetical protein
MTPRLTLIRRPQRSWRNELYALAQERYRGRWGVDLDIDVSDWTAAQLADLVRTLDRPASAAAAGQNTRHSATAIPPVRRSA